jgi:D-galactarolactone cycloisomerase
MQGASLAHASLKNLGSVVTLRENTTSGRFMPKITRLAVTSLEHVLPPGQGYGNARGVNNRRNCSLIAIDTDGGITGYGDAAGPLGVVHEYIKLLTPSFIGKSLYDFDIIAAGIRNRLYHFGSQGHFVAALGGINIAVFDAIGKKHGVPVHDLLGGRHAERLACYATTGYFTDDPKIDIEAQLSPLDHSMFVGYKIKIGAGIASDIERTRAARKAVGDKPLLMVDYNGNYTVDVALESLRRLEPFNIHWAEEPLPPHDVQGYAELRARSPVRISAGEAHHGTHDFKQLMDARGLDIVQPPLTGGGGFSEMKTVAQIAQMNNLTVSMPCWGSAIALHAALHFAASLPRWPHTDNAPYPMLVEYDVGDNPLRDLLVRNAIKPRDGSLPVPTGPGLGLELNADIVSKYTVKP